MSETEIEVPRDRQASFDSVILPKHKRDVSDIENKVLAMYQSKSQYPFLFVDCLFVPIKRDYETKECAVYNILGIRVDGRKEILGLWIQESESKPAWMQIFDELKSRGVQEVGFISMDGVSGLEEGAKAIFPEVVVQRCIVHPIRNSLKYVPTRDYKDFTAHLKKFMVQRASKLAASNLSGSARSGVNIPVRLVSGKGALPTLNNFSIIRRQCAKLCTPVNSSFRKVTKRGAFPNDNSVFKLLYLRVIELQKKWASTSSTANFSYLHNLLDTALQTT